MKKKLGIIIFTLICFCMVGCSMSKKTSSGEVNSDTNSEIDAGRETDTNSETENELSEDEKYEYDYEEDEDEFIE